jgi:hypothetical protein
MASESTSVTARTRAIAASGQRKRAAVRLLSLLACFGWPTVSSVAAAAPFQEYVSVVCNADSEFCEMAFTRPPAGKRLEMDNVSCYLRGAVDLGLSDMYLAIHNAENAWQLTIHLAPELVAESAETAVFAANHSLFAYANSGYRIYASAIGKPDAFRQFACHVSGRLVDL